AESSAAGTGDGRYWRRHLLIWRLPCVLHTAATPPPGGPPVTDEVRPAPPPRLPVPPPGRPVPSGASRRPPLWWFVGLGAVLLLSVLPGDPAAPPALGCLYLLLTGGWALLRRGSSLRAVGRRGLAGLAVVGAVLFVTGSAIAGPPATDRPAVSTEPSDPATLRPTTEPTGPAPTAAPTPTHEPPEPGNAPTDRKSTRLNSSHVK